MPDLLKAISTGFTAFTATNLDDILILLLFFSQVNSLFRRRHIVAGQYLGFAALVAISLPGFFGSMLLPRPWIGMLGIVPIAIGASRLICADVEEDEEDIFPTTQNSWMGSLLSPQSYSVAAVTFANGGDNIGIYVPLFASSQGASLMVILAVFFTLVGVWCFTAYRLTQVPAIAESLTYYGNQLVPFVLIGLGILILLDSHTLENRGLAVLTLVISGFCILHLFRSAGRTLALSVPKVKEN
ncbi:MULTISPECIES: cadmium resistance transporter [unclassified Leptolyngbya]|uniref:cadmium resistance transporter n=1 Tax=unclassified Leptolyngbya TaxID=2650499 RepID=UPI001686CC69|nr:MULTISPECIES: cadmium resistance transporter [unclassified Leptolyngbya]MBD1909893.1 cadmium resistance transporter [Leptolyngbya sp. FACHB-8]MBD2158643.1 cadmium resistance transporter [Leptolyngbya sp. FACHB-16]